MTRKRLIIVLIISLFLLLILGSQSPDERSTKPIKLPTRSNPAPTTTTLLPDPTTTTTLALEVVEAITVPETAPESPLVSDSSSSTVAGCIRANESGGLVDTNGSNDHQDGYYQIIPSTWANYKGYATAQEAPRSVQDERFNQLWEENGRSHWAAQSGKCF